MKTIITHDGSFHADEVSAIALRRVFLNEESKIIRSRDTELFKKHQENKNTIFIDVARKFDNKRFFDHHQDKFDKSSAGMTWSFIKETLKLYGFDEIDELIEKVDDTDLGRKKHGEFEFSSLISMQNDEDKYSKEQYQNFLKAIEFAENICKNLKEQTVNRQKAKEIILKSKKIMKEVLLLDEFVKEWSYFINGEKDKEQIKAVVWYDKKQKKYLIEVTPEKYGEFNLFGNKLEIKEDKNIDFVHINGFFAVADNKIDTVISFLKENGYE